MQMHFLRNLERRYLRSGHRVYSRYFSELAAAPPNWKGGLADMIVEKDGRLMAIFRVHDDHLRDPNAISRWRQALENPQTALKLFAARREQLKPLKRILRDQGISARLAVVSRGQNRPTGRLPRQLSIKVAAFLLLLVAVIALWFTALWVYDRDVPLYYEPRDLERQVEEWKEAPE